LKGLRATYVDFKKGGGRPKKSPKKKIKMKRTTNWEDGTTSFKNNNHVTFDLHFYTIE
jgi:hypothetical protein